MKIRNFYVRKKMVLFRLEDQLQTTFALSRANLWDMTLNLEHVLGDLGFAAVMPPGIPKLRQNFREHLAIQDLEIQDSGTFAKEHTERTRAGEHLGGGAWYFRIIVNDTENEGAFNTLGDFFQLLFSICMREGAYVIPGKSQTVPGLVGHA